MNLSTWNLQPGSYVLRVRAVGSSGQTSGWATANITLVNANLNAARVYPNPWRADRHAADPVTFDNLSAGSEVKIFTIAVHFVSKLSPTGAVVTWDLKNDSGDSVSSGVYLYVIKDASGGERKGKLALIKYAGILRGRYNT